MVSLNFKVFGEGQAMIIVHGLFGSLDNWLGIAKYVATKGYKVYLVDQRNHGKSPHVAEHSYEGMSDDLKLFIAEHKIEDPILVGHSMGGKTVIKFADQYPEMIEKLVVVDIGPKYYPPHHTTILDALNTLPIATITKRAEAEEHLAQSISDASIRMFLMKNLDRIDSTSFKWKMNLPVIIDQIENIGEEIHCATPFMSPTLFIAGANSDYILPQDEAAILEDFPTATFAYIPNAGHWVHAEQTETFVTTLLNFCNA